MRWLLLSLLCLVLSLITPAMARAQQINKDALAAASGFNPDQYPCAKAGLQKLYDNRQKVSGLKAYHPRHVWQKIVDFFRYYAIKISDFFKSLMNPGKVRSGFEDVINMARSGDPLGSASRKLDSWMSQLNTRSQFVLDRQAADIVRSSTNADGSCKLVR